MTSLRHLRLDGPQAMTPGAFEHLLYMPYLESLSLDKMIDVDKITEKLGIRKADEIMDRLMFRYVLVDSIFRHSLPMKRLSLPNFLPFVPESSRTSFNYGACPSLGCSPRHRRQPP